MSVPEDWLDDEPLAWSLAAGAEQPVSAGPLPTPITTEWAYGDRTGRGVRVCILDSGIDETHPHVGRVEQAVTVELPGEDEGEDATPRIVPDTAGDVSGHGTACAGIVTSLAPEVSLVSVRVLDPEVEGVFAALEAGIEWAVEQRFEILNLSLSVRSPRFALRLAQLADRAVHQGSLLVCSAHNLPVRSYPWRFGSVVSVASHEEDDPWRIYYNPEPPVEFYARGNNVPIAWPGGGTAHASGNSFATPHVAGHAALVKAAHPELTPFELKTVLYRISHNVHQQPA